jgi:hypothetical protein
MEKKAEKEKAKKQDVVKRALEICGIDDLNERRKALKDFKVTGKLILHLRNNMNRAERRRTMQRLNLTKNEIKPFTMLESKTITESRPEIPSSAYWAYIDAKKKRTKTA